MAFDYARIAATADRLIANFGKTMVVRREGLSGGPAYAPIRGEPEFFKVTAVEQEQRLQPVIGEVVKSNKTLLVRVGEGVTPAPGDQLMVTGADAFLTNPRDAAFQAEISIDRVEKLAPGPVPVLFTVYGTQ